MLATIPEEDRRQGVKNQDLITDSLPTEKALGIQRNLEHDYLGFCVCTSKILLQPEEEGQGGVKWDDPVSCDIRKYWKEWKSYLSILGDITVKRCFKPSNFKSVKEVTLHHSSDTSEEGYDQISCFRLVDTYNKIHCAFVMGKLRLAPLSLFLVWN